jgi:hypothetical protein
MSTLFSNPETIGIDRVCSVIDTIFNCNGGISGILTRMINGSLKIVTYFGAYILFKNYDKIWTPCKTLILKLIYTRLVLQQDISSSIVSKFNELASPVTPIDKTQGAVVKSNEVWVSGLPLYLEKEGNDNVIYHIPYFHSKLLDELYEYGHKEDENVNLVTVCRDEAGKVFTPLEMFASDNYIKTEKICSGYFRTYTDTKMVTPPIIMINSPAGYGKTNFVHYCGNLKQHRDIRLIDLTSPLMVNKGFSTIVAELTSKEVNVPTIICFDELDKYIVMYTQHIYTSKQQGLKKDVTSTNMDEVIDDNFQIFERQVKLSVISAMGRLDSVKNYRQGVVWMFFSNNIHTIFKGLNQTHINSVKTRFTFINFNKCGKDEIARYIRQYNDKLTDPEMKYPELRLKCALRKIRHDIDITYRDIQICMNKAAYDIELLVQYINEGVVNPLFNYDENGVELESISCGKSLGKEENVVENFEKMKHDMQRVRDKKKEKNEIAWDIVNLICDTEAQEISSLSNDEVIQQMNELSNGYNLVKLAELEITSKTDIYNITQHALYYRPKVLEYLLGLGVDVNLIVDKESLLETAMRGCSDETSAIILMNHGASLGTNYSILCKLQGSGSKVVAIIQYLIDEKGFDVNTIIYNGNTYPHHYIKSKYGGEILTVIHKFIEWGFNVKITDSQGDTILHRLLYYSNISVRNISVPVSLINELLDTGAKVDTYGSTYKSPLLLLLVKEINYEDKKALVQRFISLGACNIPLGKNEGIKVINIKNVPSDILDLIPQNMFAE